MPRTKGSKNRPKTNITKDYAAQIAEKQETIASLNTEIASIQKAIEEQKSLAWSSVLLALKNIKGEVVDRPKALGDIRGVTYIYGMFYRFGLIDVPDEVKEKMDRPKDRKK